MNIKPMLMRLEDAMARNDLREKMVLLPESYSSAFKRFSSSQSVNLIVGYNGSPKSQTALDLTLWIAHQTRLVTKKPVTVQVVYVVDENQIRACPNLYKLVDFNLSFLHQRPEEFQAGSVFRESSTAILTKPKVQSLAVAQKTTSTKQRHSKKTTFSQSDWFEQADLILWQARCIAAEWKGSFTAHLRFGDVATELRDVVESEAATLLFLGCSDVNHPIIQKLGSNLPCSVLGLPSDLISQEYSNSYLECVY